MEAERDREDSCKGSQIECGVNKSLEIYADLRISLNDKEVGISADGDAISIVSSFRTLYSLSGFLRCGPVAVRSLDQVLRHAGLTVKFKPKYLHISLLGSKANRWVVSFLSFWLS
jgi:hypothetical protein